LPPALNGELPPRGALELLFFDVGSIWPKVKVPVLAVWGDRDTIVPVQKSRALIEQFLNKAGNKDLTVKVFPGVDHGKGVSASSGDWDFPRASAEYDLAMVDWLKKKLG
jgi:dienelactone hydrolase